MHYYYYKQCCGSVSFWNGSAIDSESDLKSRKYQLLFYIFSLKKYISSKNGLFCYFWGKYLCPLNISFIFLKKCMVLGEIVHDFCWFLLPGSGFGWPKWNGSKRIRIRFDFLTDLLFKMSYPDPHEHAVFSASSVR